MNLKLLLACCLTGAFATTASAQLPRIVVQGTGGPAVYTSLDTAIQDAQPGDKLYLSGGSFLLPASYTVDKPLHFIGAGMHPDSSAVTGSTTIALVSGALRFTTEASGTTCTGIAFMNAVGYGTEAADDDPTGMVFQRCDFTGGLSLGWAEGAISSSVLDECVIRQGGNVHFNGYGGRAVVTRCIIDHCGINLFRPSGLFMKNCVVLNAQLSNSKNAIVQNCVFTINAAPLWQVRGVQISNCLITGTELYSNASGNYETNIIYDQPASSIFVNETDNTYQYSDDLHLASGSPGANAGNDGHDVGIYGSGSPYKAGAVPYDPHFQAATINGATNNQGELPVNIRMAAQSH